MPFQLAIDYNNFDIIPQIVPQQYVRDNPTFMSKILSSHRTPEKKVQRQDNDVTEEDHDSIENLRSNDMDQSDFKLHSFVKSPLKNDPIYASQGGQLSDLDLLVVDTLSRDGLYDQREITDKYVRFKKSLMELKQDDRDPRVDSVPNEQSFNHHEENIYQVKKGRIYVSSMTEGGIFDQNELKNREQVNSKSSGQVSEIEAENTVAIILKQRSYLLTGSNELKLRKDF
ncbi:UNKNOWN [Stylonychia lemnae]|uniref:Uncharacterized protein n=1 Tax=Stylonychia lemnae TaxID=5949 RepID=A0A077ZVM3_STYLE|nr:UNKNOWN [Stylonychia lemnae]|eukprot:CDW73980.1 UNKNOWN [Stylonychia lemnae]